MQYCFFLFIYGNYTVVRITEFSVLLLMEKDATFRRKSVRRNEKEVFAVGGHKMQLMVLNHACNGFCHVVTLSSPSASSLLCGGINVVDRAMADSVGVQQW